MSDESRKREAREDIENKVLAFLEEQEGSLFTPTELKDILEMTSAPTKTLARLYRRRKVVRCDVVAPKGNAYAYRFRTALDPDKLFEEDLPRQSNKVSLSDRIILYLGKVARLGNEKNPTSKTSYQIRTSLIHHRSVTAYTHRLEMIKHLKSHVVQEGTRMVKAYSLTPLGLEYYEKIKGTVPTGEVEEIIDGIRRGETLPLLPEVEGPSKEAEKPVVEVKKESVDEQGIEIYFHLFKDDEERDKTLGFLNREIASKQEELEELTIEINDFSKEKEIIEKISELQKFEDILSCAQRARDELVASIKELKADRPNQQPPERKDPPFRDEKLNHVTEIPMVGKKSRSRRERSWRANKA